MRLSASLKSRLASCKSPAVLTLAKASSTSDSPVVKAKPLARKPSTGISAITAMRMRTDNEVAGRDSLEREKFRTLAIEEMLKFMEERWSHRGVESVPASRRA